MYNTWAYRCTKYERNRILSCDRDIDGPYRHSLLKWFELTNGKRSASNIELWMHAGGSREVGKH